MEDFHDLTERISDLFYLAQTNRHIYMLNIFLISHIFCVYSF